jgi:NAD(P)-dependent dehydrogenase (short-subunit alcohol dehydrogenase family)
MPSALVTGASRGIGRGRAPARPPPPRARGPPAPRPPPPPPPAPAHHLAALARDDDRVHVLPLDVTDPTSAAACADRLAAQRVSIDLLAHNAGVWDVRGGASRGPLDALDAHALLEVLHTNSIGPLVVTQALAPRLAEGATVVNLSSGLGSLGRDVPRGNYGYAMSKAALNMATRCLAAELEGVTVIALDPGWVRTDLGGADAPLSPDEAVAGILAVLGKLTPEFSGAWLNRHGEPVDW